MDAPIVCVASRVTAQPNLRPDEKIQDWITIGRINGVDDDTICVRPDRSNVPCADADVSRRVSRGHLPLVIPIY